MRGRPDPASMDHEQIVLGVWSDVLELPVDAIGTKKNLFRLGGDSIRAMRMQARLEDIYRVKMESNFATCSPRWSSRCSISAPATSASSRLRTRSRRSFRRSWLPASASKPKP